MRSAAVVVVRNPENSALFLAISRRNDNTRWGLPGGKVDPGETSVNAALREFREEVGVMLTESSLVPIYSGVCYGKGPEDTFWGTTYLWTGDFGSINDCNPEEGLELTWACESFLSATRSSPFAAYNREMFRSLAAYGSFPALTPCQPSAGVLTC